MSANPVIALPKSLFAKVAERANSVGLSSEQWIEVAVSERIRIEEQTSEFFAARAARATGRSLSEILKNVGDNPPDPGDELE